jgi:hypothetical protein
MTKSVPDAHAVRRRTLSHDTPDNLILKNFAIDFKQVALMKKKVTQSFPDEKTMMKALDSLVDLFSNEYEHQSGGGNGGAKQLE